MPDETSYLDGGFGSARILWKEEGIGIKWGIVQFPVGHEHRRFRVQNVKADWLECYEIKETLLDYADPYGEIRIDIGTELIEVAKPYLLRQSPFLNQTRIGYKYTNYEEPEGQRRLSTREEDLTTEWQVIVPQWRGPFCDWPGDEIYAVHVPTGIWVWDYDLNRWRDVYWLDIEDQRAWGKDDA